MTTLPLRTSGVMRYRRFVTEAFVSALRSTFNSNYNKERQFIDLHVSNQYPLTKIEYPSIVVSFNDTKVQQAGVGMLEYFDDPSGVMRQWSHARFEGSLDLDIYALSPLDRDHLADAIVELVMFGRLEGQLDQFYVGLYGADQDPVELIFQQLMLNSDIMQSKGNSATIAPWDPEDTLVYQTGYRMELHGGFYNSPLTNTYGLVTNVGVSSYPQGEVQVIIPLDINHALTNPFFYEDAATVRLKGGLAP